MGAILSESRQSECEQRGFAGRAVHVMCCLSLATDDIVTAAVVSYLPAHLTGHSRLILISSDAFSSCKIESQIKLKLDA